MIRGFMKPALRHLLGRDQRSRRIAQRVLRVESLEFRRVLAIQSVPLIPPAAGIGGGPEPAALVIEPSSAAPTAVTVRAATSLGQQVASYLTSKMGTRIGGGECSHMAIEALRVSGAKFIRWYESPPVAELTRGSQVAGKRFQVGDIVQFENAAFSNGRFTRHHTQVVAAVDGNGRITKVFEQNVGGNRTVRRNNAVDLTKLTGGTVTIYRPTPRVDQPRRLEFTVVNNTNSSQTYTRQIGSSSSTLTLDKANTVGSYRFVWLTVPNGATASLRIGNSSVQIRNAGAYELYTAASGRTAIRALT